MNSPNEAGVDDLLLPDGVPENTPQMPSPALGVLQELSTIQVTFRGPLVNKRSLWVTTRSELCLSPCVPVGLLCVEFSQNNCDVRPQRLVEVLREIPFWSA